MRVDSVLPHPYVQPAGEGKICGGCSEFKPFDQFSWNSHKATGKKYRCSRCKSCKAKHSSDWLSTDHGKKKAHSHKLKKYGMTAKDYDSILANQGGVCAVCKGIEFIPRHKNGTIQRLSVDHCHITGKVRGLLCNNCNRAIGLLGDDHAVIQSCISYLQRHHHESN